MLALGIGVNTAMFSVIDAVLLCEAPYRDPHRLISVRQKFPQMGDLSLATAPAEYIDYRDRSRAFASMAGYEALAFDLTGGREPVRVEAQRVTHTLFATLGVSAAAGRTFTEREDQLRRSIACACGLLTRRRGSSRARPSTGSGIRRATADEPPND